MPELPEVEVCRLGISPHIVGQTVSDVVVRHWQLRWPIPEAVLFLHGLTVEAVERRSKYLIIKFSTGSLIIHLGMSGTLRILDSSVAPVKHDHFDLLFTNGVILRLNDPRRFGAVIWLHQHQDFMGIFNDLGPEPLTDDFAHDYLFYLSRSKKTPIKTFIMTNSIVVGVGNIYANEALFLSGIRPTTLAGDITKRRYNILTDTIKAVLAAAITQGGTTLKDFTQSDGKPGYFTQSLNVYGRAGQPCTVCSKTLIEVRQANRSSVYCPKCQKN